jgi:mannose-6-phosphate isomerase
MDPLEVFALEPVLVERPWGGRRLESFGKRLPEGVPIGESWEVCDLPAAVAPHVVDPRSRVAGGPLAGLALTDLIEQFGERLLGSTPPTVEGDFPLLVKLLDARENLSVQVHPNAAYAHDHPESRLKTESWYIVDAAEEAELFLDFRSDVTLDEIDAAFGTPAIVGLLRRVPAEVGGFHRIPGGLAHALGAGVMVVEVQTPSDSTFRLYDWSQEYGRGSRPLHLGEARESLILGHPDAMSLAPSTQPGVRDLDSNPHYWIREHRSRGELGLARAPEVRVLVVVAGKPIIDGRSHIAGATVMVPAEAVSRTSVSAAEDVVVLEVGLGVRPDR